MCREMGKQNNTDLAEISLRLVSYWASKSLEMPSQSASRGSDCQTTDFRRIEQELKMVLK